MPGPNNSKSLAAAESRSRLVLCTCLRCRLADKNGVGMQIERWKKREHEKSEIAEMSSIRQRGRASGTSRGALSRARGAGFRGRGGNASGRGRGYGSGEITMVKTFDGPSTRPQPPSRTANLKESADNPTSHTAPQVSGSDYGDYMEQELPPEPYEHDTRPLSQFSSHPPSLTTYEGLDFALDRTSPPAPVAPEMSGASRAAVVSTPEGNDIEMDLVSHPVSHPDIHHVPDHAQNSSNVSGAPPSNEGSSTGAQDPRLARRATRIAAANAPPSRRSNRVVKPSSKRLISMMERERKAEEAARRRRDADSDRNGEFNEDGFEGEQPEEFDAALDLRDRDEGHQSDSDSSESHIPHDIDLTPPDDIQLITPRQDAHDIYISSHEFWFIRILLTIVAFLHTRYHVSFRACDILLSCLNFIFLALKLIDIDSQIPRNLGTVIKRLELEDRFTVYPLCHICHRIFKPNIPVTSVCPDCDTALFKAISPTLFQRVTGKTAPPPPPVSAAPIQVLSSLLVDLLAQPGIEEAAEEWKTRIQEPGTYKDIMDGNVWKTMKCPDGSLFFDPQDNSGELRLGVTLSLDWFGRKTSVYGPSHSSGAFSFSVSNLPASLRYRAGNLLLAAMTPGPTEPSAEQLQNYIKIIVDDLKKLYEDGIPIPTPSKVDGRVVRVSLLGVICDHPAMCKVCGAADHGHTVSPCHRCFVTLADLFSDQSLENGFPLRDGEEHRRLCNEWKALESSAERKDFFSEHGVRWTELARLPYFDLVRCSVVDPMHNLLLGIVKTQWYTQWILCGTLRKSTSKQGRELDAIHQFLESFESPLWAGKLPLRVGEPAGGSLSADEYKFAVTTALPIIIPIVWEMFEEESSTDFQKAYSRWEVDSREYEKALASWEKTNSTNTAADNDSAAQGTAQQSGTKKRKVDAKPTPPKKPARRMQDGEAVNFLRLATALKILLSSSIDEPQLQRAETLLLDYLQGYKELYSDANMKPNHAWSVHIVDQIRDFGPVYSFWTFVSERLNKLLKNFNSNSRKGGQLEISMMRSFGREKQLRAMLEVIANEPENETVGAITSKLLRSGEAHGTVEDAASGSAVLNDGLCQVRIQPGTVANTKGVISAHARAHLFRRYNSDGNIRVRYALDREAAPELPILSEIGQFYNYALLDGRRITPTSRSLRKSAGSSIVCVLWEGKRFGGEVEHIFHHIQPGIQESSNILFAQIRWMKYLELTAVEGDPWNDFPELQIEFWALNEFWPPGSVEVPPTVVPFDKIQCQLSRGTIETTEPSMWVTTSMERHAISSPDADADV